MPNLSWLAAVAATIVAGMVLALIKYYLDRQLDLQRKNQLRDDQLESDVELLKLRTAVLDVQLAPYRILQKEISEQLHHPDPSHERSDYLLEQLNSEPPKITPAEREELKQYLRHLSVSVPGQVKAAEGAMLLLALMPRVVAEAQAVESTRAELAAKVPQTEVPKTDPEDDPGDGTKN